MHPPEDQPDSSPAPRYIDPEEFDMSEQQFSASLEDQDPRPRFVLERSPDGTKEPRQTPAQPPTVERNGLNASDDNQSARSLGTDDGRSPEGKGRIIPDSEPPA